MRLAVLSDTHLAPAGTPPTAWHNAIDFDRAEPLLRAAVAALATEQADAVAFLGDLTHFGDPASVNRALDLVASLDRPIWAVPGNHDLDSEPGALTEAGERAISSVTVAPWATASTAGFGVAGVDLANAETAAPESIAALRNARNASPLVVLTHYPVLSLADQLAAEGLADAGDVTNRDDLDAALRPRSGPTIVLHGHLHVRASRVRGRILQLSGAALIEPPHECWIVDIDPGDVATTVTRRSIVVAESDVPRAPVLSPEKVVWTYAGGAWRLVG